MLCIDRWYGIDKPQDPPDDVVLAAMGASWETHLTNAKDRDGRNRPVPENRIRDVYDEAVTIYENKGPFGINELLEAWKRICERDDARPAPVKRCTWPEGHADEDMNVLVWFPAFGKEVLLPCPDCRSQASIRRHQEVLEKLAAEKSNVRNLATARQKSETKKASTKTTKKKATKKK